MRRAALFAVLMATLILALACNGNDDTTGASGGEDGTATLIRAGEALAKASSFHFVLSHDNGTTPVIFDLAMERAEGDVEQPNKMRADLKARQGKLPVEVKVIAIDRDVWVTDPFLGRWQKLGGVSFPPFLAPQVSIPTILKGATNARLHGEEEIDGVATRRLTATIEGATLGAIAPVVEVDKPVPVTLWIGKDDDLVRRIHIDGPLTKQEKSNIRRKIDVSRYNQPAGISPP